MRQNVGFNMLWLHGLELVKHFEIPQVQLPGSMQWAAPRVPLHNITINVTLSTSSQYTCSAICHKNTIPTFTKEMCVVSSRLITNVVTLHGDDLSSWVFLLDVCRAGCVTYWLSSLSRRVRVDFVGVFGGDLCVDGHMWCWCPCIKPSVVQFVICESSSLWRYFLAVEPLCKWPIAWLC